MEQRHSTRVAAATLGALLSVGALAPQPGTFPEALARRGCTQEDAPALEVYLTATSFDGAGEPREAYIRIEIAGREVGALVGEEIELAPLSRAGRDPSRPLARAELNTPGCAPEWLQGTVTLRRVETDRRVEGAYRLRGRGGRTWAATFVARWVASPGGCG